MEDKQTQRLVELLFYRYETEGTSLFALLDAARDPAIYQAIRYSGFEHQCLFTGQLSADLQAASPYLLRIVPDTLTFPKLLEQGWGRSWGLFLAARAGIFTVRRHLRTLLEVRTQDRQKLFFRYYDPRVLRLFLPTCDAAQLNRFFGPIHRFDMETPDGSQLLRFRLEHRPLLPVSLRSWSYPLAERRDADDDRGTLLS